MERWHLQSVWAPCHQARGETRFLHTWALLLPKVVIILERKRWMEYWAYRIYFYFLSDWITVIKAALGITRLTNLCVIPPPTLFQKWLFPRISFYLALNNTQLLHTGRPYRDLGIISDLFACISAPSSLALSDWKPQCKHLSLLTHECQWGNHELIIIVLRVLGWPEKLNLNIPFVI